MAWGSRLGSDCQLHRDPSDQLKSEVFQLEGFSYGPSTVTVPLGGEPGPGCTAYKVCAPDPWDPPLG